MTDCVRNSKPACGGSVAAVARLARLLFLAFLSASSFGEDAPNPCIKPAKETPGRFIIKVDNAVSIEVTAEDEECERVMREGRIKAYEAGWIIGIRGEAVPVFDMSLLWWRDIAALNPLLDLLSGHGIPVHDLDIRFAYEPDRSPNFVGVEQFIGGQSVGHLDLMSIKPGGGDPRSSVSGVLVNPGAPQLNRDKWMTEETAIRLATDILMQYVKTDGSSIQFLTEVAEGKLAGKLRYNVVTSEDGMTVSPVYEVLGDRAVVRINVFDGSVETFEDDPVF